MSRDGRQVPLDQIGHSEIRLEEPILKRRDRVPTVTIRSEISEATQPPEVSKQVMSALQPLIASLPARYRIDMGGSIEEATKANDALAKIFPIMIAITLIVIMLQVRSFSMMTMVLLTAPLGVIGVVPTLLVFNGEAEVIAGEAPLTECRALGSPCIEARLGRIRKQMSAYGYGPMLGSWRIPHPVQAELLVPSSKAHRQIKAADLRLRIGRHGEDASDRRTDRGRRPGRLQRLRVMPAQCV